MGILSLKPIFCCPKSISFPLNNPRFHPLLLTGVCTQDRMS